MPSLLRAVSVSGLLGVVGLAGCGSGFDAVSIKPIYGWADGCATVEITGRGFGDDVKATVGGKDVTTVALPAKDSLDYGYSFTARVPAAEVPGYADVVVTTGDKSDTITGSGAYYYIQCPGPGTLDGASPSAGLKAGDTVTLSGCGLGQSLRARLLDANQVQAGADLALTQTCGAGEATFTLPPNPDGTYYLQLVNEQGQVLAGEPCPPPDSADTAYSCADFQITYGGGQ